MFASGSLGSGRGIDPETNLIVSPLAGKVTMTYQTGHAIGITSDNGNEYLIHIGINTVNLKGEGFDVQVKEQQEVKQGDPLVQVDFAKIKQAGYDPTVLIIALNKPDNQLNYDSVDQVTVDDRIFSTRIKGQDDNE